MRIRVVFLCAAAAVVGCGNSSGNGNNDMSVGGGGGDGGTMPPDMVTPLDMVDTTTLPAPTSMHVGMTGTTAGLQTAGVTAAAYLLNPAAGAPSLGELHVVTAAGADKTVDTGVSINGYALSSDGKHVIYTKPAANGNGSLFWADVSVATVAPKTIFNGTYAAPQLTGGGFMAPSTHYFLAGVHAPNVAASLDLHVIDMANGNDVYDLANGGFDYLEVVLPDDTMIFQDTANGQTANSPPVQTLYWTSLSAPAMPSQTNTITTRTSQFVPTVDNKNVVVLKTSGDLFVWNVTAKTLSATALASGVAKFVLGTGTNGPVAYLGGDGSVHVIGLDGTKTLDTAASAATSLNAPLVLAADSADVYFFQNGNLVTGGVQNNMGTLMRVAVAANATPSKIADNVSILDLRVTDNAILFLQNLMTPPQNGGIQFGDAAKANRDGSGIMPLGMKVPVGGLMAVNPGPDTWFAMNLTMGVDDTMGKTTIDNSPLCYGALTWNDSTGAAAVTLDAKVQQGEFAFAADDGRTAAFVAGATYDATLAQYTGALKLLAARAPSMTVDGMLTGAAQLGPILNRSLFVSAPKATMAGIYFVKY